jgi:hypothetical protein
MIEGDPLLAGADIRADIDPSVAENSGSDPAQLPPARAARRSRPIRRVPKPRMTGPLDSPVRNLVVGVCYVLTVMALATAAYMAVGWSFRDAIYMVISTVYTVGYEEVRPINTPALNIITLSLIVLGCTGIIFLTGALVQFITLSQINRIIGQTHDHTNRSAQRTRRCLRLWTPRLRTGAGVECEQRRFCRHRGKRGAL